MSYRIGTDLCNPKRIQATYKKFGDKFLRRILTDKEKKYVLSSKPQMIKRLAGRYAAKEAVSKALGIGIRKGIDFKDIEVVHGEHNMPKLVLHNEALAEAKKQGLNDWSISISHEDIMVIATVIAS